VATVGAVGAAVRGLPRPRVFFAEWLEPPFCAGHWLPEMIALAGGVDVLGRPGEPSHATTWETVFALEPELVVVGPCGFGAEDATERAEGIEWPCPAVAVDGDGYYSRPGPRLADGVEQLGHLFHPEAVSDPGLPAISLRAGFREGADPARPATRAALAYRDRRETRPHGSARPRRSRR
jgi:iron complex transport system substrate-binding protein